MKKFMVLMLLLMAFSVTMLAQEGEKKITETEWIVDKYGGAIVDGAGDFTDKVGSVLTSLGQKLEKPASEVFEIYVRYYKAKGFFILLAIPLFFLFAILGLFYMKHAEYYEEDWNRSATMSIVFAVGTFVFFVIAAVNTGNGLLYFIAPEYFVIQDILELVKEIV